MGNYFYNLGIETGTDWFQTLSVQVIYWTYSSYYQSAIGQLPGSQISHQFLTKKAKVQL